MKQKITCIRYISTKLDTLSYNALKTKSAFTHIRFTITHFFRFFNLHSLLYTTFVIFVAVFSISAPNVYAHDKQLVTVIGDLNYEPFSFVEKGEAKGIYVDILKEVFNRIDDYNVSIKMLPWKRGLQFIGQGVSFAIFPPYYWPEKRPFISHYSEPLLEEKVVIFCNKKANINMGPITWPNDFYGLRIAVNRGFLSPGPKFFNAVDNNRISLQQSSSTMNGLRLLIRDRADCYINSKLSILWSFRKLEKQGEYNRDDHSFYLAYVISKQWGYIGYAMDKEGTFPYKMDFLAKSNSVIKQMKQEQKIEKIIDNFLNK